MNFCVIKKKRFYACHQKLLTCICSEVPNNNPQTIFMNIFPPLR